MTCLEKLDNLIKDNDLNRRSFALQSGIPYTTIYYWYKQNTDRIKLETLRKISDFFGVSLTFWNSDEETVDTDNRFLEFLPYLAKADEATLDIVRKILDMPQKTTASVSSTEAV